MILSWQSVYPCCISLYRLHQIKELRKLSIVSLSKGIMASFITSNIFSRGLGICDCPITLSINSFASQTLFPLKSSFPRHVEICSSKVFRSLLSFRTYSINLLETTELLPNDNDIDSVKLRTCPCSTNEAPENVQSCNAENEVMSTIGATFGTASLFRASKFPYVMLFTLIFFKNLA